MTVKEVIEELKKYPEDLPVRYYDYLAGMGVADIDVIALVGACVMLN